MSAPTRGLGLIEVLVGGAIGSVVVAGSMKSLQLSLESAQVVRSSLSESELRFSLAQILTNEEDCKANLKPTADNVPDPKAVGLYGAKRDWGRGEVVQLKKNIGNNVAGDASTEADDILLVEQGVSFKGDLNIVKMVLKGSSAEDDNNNPKKGLRTRTFVVYYRKEGMGSFSTLGGEDCTESDQKGCYFNQCQVEYQLQDQANPEVTKCQVADCVNYGSGGSGGQVDCYHADDQDGIEASGKARTLIGCGGPEGITASQTTAIGYGAGSSSSTGQYNVFIGYKAGNKNIGGVQNTAIGTKAGLNNISGNNNTFIGQQTGEKTTSDSNTFIGSVAGLNNTTGTGNTFIGMNSGNKNATSSSNTFVGTNAGFMSTGGDNTFIGLQSGYNTTGNNNTFIGINAGHGNTTGANNTAIGHSAGFALTTGTQNTLIGQGAKAPSATGSQQLNIGNLIVGRGPASAPTFDSTATTTTGMPQGEVRILGGPLKVCDNTGGSCKATLKASTCPSGQFLDGSVDSNGNLVCKTPSFGALSVGTLTVDTVRVKTLKANGKTPNSLGTPEDIIVFEGKMVATNRFVAPGLVTKQIWVRKGDCDNTGCGGNNGVMMIGKASGSDKGTIWAEKGYLNHTFNNNSSRVFKKNIVPYEDLDKSLDHIVNTPLFTYQYKEDLPNKTRMGIISEELPSFLQIKDKVAPSQPDWVSIYGTLWAGIKALFQKFKAFQENTIQEISHIKKQLKVLDSKAQKQALELTKQAGQMLKEIMDLKAQFKETKKQVEKSQKEFSAKAKEQSQTITQIQKELSTKTKEQSQTITQLQKEQDSKIQAQAQTIAKQAQAIEQLKLALEKQSELTDQLKKEHQKLTADLEK